jgi:hypothetical protein
MPYFDYMWFSNEQLYLLDQSGMGAIFEGNDFIYWGTLVAWLISSVGMYFFIPLARILFALLSISGVLLSLVYGVQVLSPSESTLSGLIGMIDGAILVMAFITSVGLNFEKNS